MSVLFLTTGRDVIAKRSDGSEEIAGSRQNNNLGRTNVSPGCYM